MEEIKMVCPYCSIEENGDIPDTYPGVIEVKYEADIKVAYKDEDVDLLIKTKKAIQTFVDFDGTGYLSLTSFVGDGDDEKLIEKQFKINYCPICGKKFKHGEL